MLFILLTFIIIFGIFYIFQNILNKKEDFSSTYCGRYLTQSLCSNDSECNWNIDSKGIVSSYCGQSPSPPAPVEESTIPPSKESIGEDLDDWLNL